MKNVVITQSNYIPWKGYFDAIALADEFVIYDDMQYTKRDWRNRNIIRTPSGNKWLTIPVEVKGKYFQRIRDTRISDKNWAGQHWNIIREAYRKSENYNFHKDFLENLYMTTSEDFLTDVNQRFLSAICSELKIPCHFRISSEFDLKTERNERLAYICGQLGATHYYTGPAAKDYLDESVFTEKNIKISYLEYSGYPEYKQLQQPFDHYVSIIDLMLCEGKNAVQYLKCSNG